MQLSVRSYDTSIQLFRAGESVFTEVDNWNVKRSPILEDVSRFLSCIKQSRRDLVTFEGW